MLTNSLFSSSNCKTCAGNLLSSAADVQHECHARCEGGMMTMTDGLLTYGMAFPRIRPSDMKTHGD